VRKTFVSEVESELASLWNEQRTLCIRRAFDELIYPKLARESLDRARAEAQAVMVAECAYQLRRRALGPPFRIPLAEPAVDETAQPAAHKKRKQRQRGWRPSEGDYFERPARVVGCSLVQPPLGQRNTGGTKEIVFVAIDEHGELVDRLRCRYLLTNIRVRGGPRGEMGEVGESRCSALDVERKLGELSRLETFFHEVGCEAIAVGACDLICRRIQVPSLYLPCTFPVPSPYLPCTFPVPSLYLPCTPGRPPPPRGRRTSRSER